MFGATVIDKDLAIPLGAAIACAVFVWKASSIFKGVMTKLREHDEAFEKIAVEIKALGSARILDMDILRSEMAMTSNGSDGANLCVLIVDDNEDDRGIFKRMLQRSFECDTAGSLAEATARIRLKRYDCVLLDLSLPDAHQGTTVQEFAASNPGAVCVVLTGNEDPNMRELALRQGANGYVLKNNQNPGYMARAVRNAIMRKSNQ